VNGLPLGNATLKFQYIRAFLSLS